MLDLLANAASLPDDEVARRKEELEKKHMVQLQIYKWNLDS